MRILLVETDRVGGAGIARALRSDGHKVDWARSAADARASVQAVHVNYDLVVLAENFPHKRGRSFLRGLRRFTAAPVLLVASPEFLPHSATAIDDVDDFTVKPVDLDELRTRVQALSLRSTSIPQLAFETATLRLDPRTRRVARDGVEIRLTDREYSVLYALIKCPGRFLSRAELEKFVYSWPHSIASNAIEFIIHRLRKKVGRDQIQNNRGQGWRLVP